MFERLIVLAIVRSLIAVVAKSKSMDPLLASQRRLGAYTLAAKLMLRHNSTEAATIEKIKTALDEVLAAEWANTKMFEEKVVNALLA